MKLEEIGSKTFLGYEFDRETGELINAPCCCWDDDHRDHPYCAPPTDALLEAERLGLIGRELRTRWVWVII